MKGWSGRQAIAAGAVVASLLLVAGVSVWQWWPAKVAPELTPQMVKAIGHSQQTVTLVGGGSREDAHTLWERYHDRGPNGHPPESPRLLGISLAKVETDSAPGSGTYWVVYFDRVWNQAFGPDASASGFGREVTLVDPGSLRGLGATLF
ncbi:hypothetical protein [Nocardioides koreensis]|uniref:hypothetical protein n=1 Tax=Nocardioides koreensis TaxID=433651 RepID=UPI0031CEBEF2